MNITRLTPTQHRLLLITFAASATASDYLLHLRDAAAATPNAPCILFCRESSTSQRAHLPAQIRSCKRALDAHGLNWSLGVVRAIGPANSPEVRRLLSEAAALAKQHNGLVVAESPSRFVRAEAYDSKANRNALPSKNDFMQLRADTYGVPLVTIHHPDLPPVEERRCQTKRGMLPLAKRGGRPRNKQPGYMKLRRLNDEPIAIARRNEGWSYGQIARHLRRSKSTVQHWLRPSRTKNS